MSNSLLTAMTKTTKYGYVPVITVAIVAASVLMNYIFIKNYFDLKRTFGEREQIIKEQKKAIEDQNLLIARLNSKLDILSQQVDDLEKKRQDIENKKKQDLIYYSKPLQKQEEDEFFSKRGFHSVRTNDASRVFTNDDVVKLQTIIIENENMKQELQVAGQLLSTKDSMIETYKQKCVTQENIIESYRKIEEERQKEIKKYKAELATNKIYKWTAIIVGGIVVGAVATH